MNREEEIMEEIETNRLNPMFNYLLDLDKPVEACVKAFMAIYDTAVGCIALEVESKKHDSSLDPESIQNTFNDKIAKLMKLHDLTIFQFVDTPTLVDSLKHLMHDMVAMNTYDDCAQLLDKWRGRPVDVYYIPEEGEEPLESDTEPVLAFRNACTDIPNMYNPEFKEFVDQVNSVISDKLMRSEDKSAKTKKAIITEVTANYPYYMIHRLFSCMVVPAGHIDETPDTVNIDGKWYNKADCVEVAPGKWELKHS